MIKTHISTGLKYLCVTTKKNWISYTGSGKYWKEHLAIHGKKFETELLFESEDLEIFKEKCLYYSKFHQVRESDEWANLIEETGQPGCLFYDLSDHKQKEIRQKLSSSVSKYISSLSETERLKRNIGISEGKKNTSQDLKDRWKTSMLKTRATRDYSDLFSRYATERQGAGNPMAQSIEVDEVIYGSVKDASAALGITYYMLKKRLNSADHPTYKRIKDESN